MTANYLRDEVDEWNPQRGSGLLKLRPVTDIQDSWLAFSHRCMTLYTCLSSLTECLNLLADARNEVILSFGENVFSLLVFL